MSSVKAANSLRSTLQHFAVKRFVETVFWFVAKPVMTAIRSTRKLGKAERLKEASSVQDLFKASH